MSNPTDRLATRLAGLAPARPVRRDEPAAPGASLRPDGPVPARSCCSSSWRWSSPSARSSRPARSGRQGGSTLPSSARTSPGIAPRREPAARFPVRFYLVAMIFVIFDIEIVFLYPFAVMFRQLALFGLVEIASFAVVVFIAFAYLVSEGALDWGRGSGSGSRSGAPVARSLNATIRRVGRGPAALPGAGTARPRHDAGARRDHREGAEWAWRTCGTTSSPARSKRSSSGRAPPAPGGPTSASPAAPSR